jgi:hypothetical protein
MEYTLKHIEHERLKKEITRVANICREHYLYDENGLEAALYAIQLISCWADEEVV